MAQVVGIATLCRLLASGEAAGARLVWIDGEKLMLGADLGSRDFEVNLGTEKLMNLRGASASDDAGAALKTRRVALESSGGDGAPPPSAAALGRRASTPKPFDLPSFSGRRTGSYSFILEGEIFAARSQKEVLLIGLSAIERMRPGTLAKLEQEKLRTKRVVSRRRDALNEDVRLAEKFSQAIEDGWWVFTNNSFPETEKFLRRAASLAGVHVDIRKLA